MKRAADFPAARLEELELVNALRRADEAAFAALVDRYHASMRQVALAYVANRAVAEEVVQEAWLGVLQGIGRFEARSSLKTWIFSIVMNRAKSRAVQEARSVGFSSVEGETEATPVVDSARFRSDHDPRPGTWASPPLSWSGIPEARLLSNETLNHVRKAIDALPPTQREVITLRDVAGWSAPEVCNVLSISETNQRVLLHRARSRVRAALEGYLKQ